MLTSLWRDLVYAGRSLAKARAFTVVCVVTLGIGMVPVIAIPYGARIFQVPPPGLNPDGLVELVTTPRGSRAAGNSWSYPDFETLREADTGLTLIGWKSGATKLAIETPSGVRTESVGTMFVSANYFRTIGVALARGAGFDQTADDPSTAQPVVILGYGYWQNHMGADPAILGKTLTLEAIPHVVVGVAPEHFFGHLGFQARELFLPLGRYPSLRTDEGVRVNRGDEWLYIHGRLPSGVGVAQASAAVAAVTARLATQYPATNEFKAGIVVPYTVLGYLDRSQFAFIGAVALTVTGFVLVVVCLNISGMMQARSAMRERELSIRQAIGASRGQLAQYLTAEAVVLAALGAVLGSVVLFNIPPLLFWWLDRPVPLEIQEGLRIDASIIGICIGLCLTTSLVFGWLPALRFSRPAIITSLKDDAGAGGFRAGRVHQIAVALQITVAVPLMALSCVSLDRVRATATADLGFDSDLLYAAPLTFEGVADKSSVPDKSVVVQIQTARDSLDQASGVASVTVADGLPLDFDGRAARVSLQVDKNSAPRMFRVQTTRVADGYLDTMGIPLLLGRDFSPDDRTGGEMVTIISKALADQLVPNAVPDTILGQRLTFGTEEETQHTLTIVGVTRDVPTSQISTDRAQLLLPLAQHPSPNVFLVARSSAGEQPTKMTAVLENAIRRLGRDFDRSLTTEDGYAPPRIITGVWLRERSVRDFLVRSAVTGSAGSVILVLAGIGIYGIVGLMVASRTREIAVRSALGASRRGVLGMILFDVVKLAMPGVVVGLLLTVVLVRLTGDNSGIRLSNAEPLAYIGGAAMVVLVALLASLTHARRAASVQPIVAMRSV